MLGDPMKRASRAPAAAAQTTPQRITAAARASAAHAFLALPILTTVITVIITTACSEPKPPGRVLLVGIDGASMRIIEPMMAEGRLPTLSAIAQQTDREAMLSASVG